MDKEKNIFEVSEETKRLIEEILSHNNLPGTTNINNSRPQGGFERSINNIERYNAPSLGVNGLGSLSDSFNRTGGPRSIAFSSGLTDFRRVLEGFDHNIDRFTNPFLRPRASNDNKHERIVAVAGFGYSGSLFARSILQDAAPGDKLRLVLIDKHIGNMYGGEAYGNTNASDFHRTNINIARLENLHSRRFRYDGRPLGSTSFLSGNQQNGTNGDISFAGRSDILTWWENAKVGQSYVKIPQELMDVELKISRSIPRQIMQLFFKHKIHEQAFLAKQRGVELVIDLLHAEVLKYEEGDRGVHIEVKHTHADNTSEIMKIESHVLCLSTGHNRFKKPRFLGPEFEKSERYIGSQYSAKGRKSFDDMAENSPDARVLIIGTGLSAYDAAVSLIKRGFKGKIDLISRGGYEHFRYKKDEGYEVPFIAVPRFVNYVLNHDADEIKADTQKQAMVIQLLQEEFRSLTGVNIDFDFDKWQVRGISQDDGNHPYTTEQVLESWEQHVPQLMRVFGAKTVVDWISKNSSLITTLRAGVSYEVSEIIEEAKASGQLNVIAGSINSMKLSEDKNEVNVSYTPKGSSAKHDLSYQFVVSALGLETLDYTNPLTRSDMWNNAIMEGYARVHQSGWGIDTDEFGRVINKDGIVSHKVYVAGTPNSGARLMSTRFAHVGAVLINVPGMSEPIVRAARMTMNTLSNPLFDYPDKMEPVNDNSEMLHSREVDWMYVNS